MNFFFLTGETSGDEIAAPVVRHLLSDADHQVSAWGGHALRQTGAIVTKDISTLAVMGFAEVVGMGARLPQLMQQAKQDIVKSGAEVFVAVDYGYFNLRLVKWAFQRGLRVVYLSPPKVWASRQGRAKKLQKYCHEIIVVFPFEQKMFASLGVTTSSFGHPTLRDVSPLASSESLAILPGSRRQEVKSILPDMIVAYDRSPYPHATISCAKGIDPSLIESIISTHTRKPWNIWKDDIYDLMADKEMALVTSGTATIHCLLTETLQVVCYKTSAMTYQLAKFLIRVPYIALPNLMAEKEIVPELIQDNCNPEEILRKMKEVKDNCERVKIEYSNIKKQLCRQDTIACIVNAILGKTK